MKKPIVALMYDFDKTLSPKDMQEYTFIPNLNMTPEKFWNEANGLSAKQKMDRILSYMYTMIDLSNANHKSIKREDFVRLGKDIEFFPGVEDWFARTKEFGAVHGVMIEHYIISSGLREIIEGTSISKHFKEIYACEFFYDHNGTAAWPKMAVNYTGKTQYLYRINKGVLDTSDDDSLNEYVPDEERRIPFRNMIYFGDGPTDVPCMKLVKVNGGTSIAVYPKGKKDRSDKLLKDSRVNFIVPADYSEEGELDVIVKNTIRKLALENQLTAAHLKQRKAVYRT